MVDLASLRGIVPELSQVPALAYFHENQFAYPENSSQHPSLDAQMVNLYTALSAEKVIFNSHYNKKTFLVGVEQMLAKFPDEKPQNLSAIIQQKSCCIPVGIDKPNLCPSEKVRVNSPVSLVWNHRWEYDKGPDRLLACLRILPKNLALNFHIMGQVFRRQPEEFKEIKVLLQERQWLATWGFVESRSEYLSILDRAHLVLSTAMHDFQGLALLEAGAAGCLPLAPNRLAYTEFLPAHCLYASTIHDIQAEARDFAVALENAVETIQRGEAPGPPDLSRLYWHNLKKTYAAAFESAVEEGVSFAAS